MADQTLKFKINGILPRQENEQYDCSIYDDQEETVKHAISLIQFAHPAPNYDELFTIVSRILEQRISPLTRNYNIRYRSGVCLLIMYFLQQYQAIKEPNIEALLENERIHPSNKAVLCYEMLRIAFEKDNK